MYEDAPTIYAYFVPSYSGAIYEYTRAVITEYMYKYVNRFILSRNTSTASTGSNIVVLPAEILRVVGVSALVSKRYRRIVV